MNESNANKNVRDIRKLLDSWYRAFESCSETVDYDVEEVEHCGELAFASVPERTIILPRSGADATVVNGVHLTIFRRQPGAEWLIVRDVSSLIGAE